MLPCVILFCGQKFSPEQNLGILVTYVHVTNEYITRIVGNLIMVKFIGGNQLFVKQIEKNKKIKIKLEDLYFDNCTVQINIWVALI